ncbi:sialate O-acetylesterase [Flavobacteriaceae bacterium]|nr:sialate O-acetylesterase [Flavobacteriaceae bacterium]
MIKKTLKVAICFTLLICTQLQAQQKTKIILFGGQSNTRGKGDFSKLTVEDKALLKDTQEKVTLALYENKEKTIAPLHAFKASARDTKKYGPEWFFGPELFIGMNFHKQYPNQEFLFIKHAVGGTSLHADWNVDTKADIPKSKNNGLYYKWIAYINEVLGDLDMDKYEIVGMFWIQGESDNPGMKPNSPKAEYSKNYKHNFTNLVNKVRTDLDLPTLPFYALQIGKLPFKEVAKELDNLYILQHNGKKGTGKYIYPMYPQSHYNYEGMSKIGTNFAELYIETSGSLIE